MKNIYKSLLALTLGLSMAGTAANLNLAFAADAKAPAQFTVPANQDRLVATMDGSYIFLNEIKAYLPKGASKYTASQIRDAVRNFAYAKLKAKFDKIIAKEAALTKAEWDNILYDIAAKNGITYDQLVESLKAHNQYNTLRQTIQKQKNDAFYAKILVPQVDYDQLKFEALKAYEIYKAEGKLAQVETNKVSYILLKTSPIFSDKQAEAKLNQIYSQTTSGKLSFADAAKEYSDDLISAVDGGTLGKTADLPPEQKMAIDKALASLKVGQVTKPLNVPGLGWVLIKLDGKAKADADMNYYLAQVFKKEEARINNTKDLRGRILNTSIIRFPEDLQ